MDRIPYQLPFTSERIPAWRCPICRAGHLALEAKSLNRRETADSRAEHEHEAWEPGWVRSRFSCLFVCNNSACKEPIACCGEAAAKTIEYEDSELGWVQSAEHQFTPKYFEPPLILMDIPEKCPPDAYEHLVASFGLSFADPGASLNSARSAVEAVLTHLGVKRFQVAAGKKRRLVPLHRRIELLPAKFKEQSDLLLAVKWLGNTGSHDGEKPRPSDVLVTYDILEHALSEIYESKSKKLKAVAKKAIAKKGRLK